MENNKILNNLINKQVKLVSKDGDFSSVYSGLFKSFDEEINFICILDSKTEREVYINVVSIDSIKVMED